MAIPFNYIKAKPHLGVNSILADQIYIVDGFFSPADLRAVLTWAQSLELEGPKKAGRGEAERTGSRASLQSPEIASELLRLILPHLPALSPPYTAKAALSPNIRVYHYPAHTFFGQHYDMPQLDPASRRQSCWTVLIYLADGVKGGSTIFYPHENDRRKGRKNAKSGGQKGQEEKIVIEPKAGRMLLHWHGVSGGGCIRHEGEVVVSGDKWVLRTDVLA
ncbi:hypothetical protein L204_103083 [Cryptococcus depauperatus]|nr:hypothetical protein L204_00169 [Cryptococcus depauperatus CBS 7855]